MMPRHTHTCVVLEVDGATYNDIRDKLKAAGYDHVFNNDDEYGVTIDMTGIMLAPPICGHCNGSGDEPGHSGRVACVACLGKKRRV